MTLYNETNEYFEQVKKNDNENNDYIHCLIDDVIAVKYGGYALAFEWEYIGMLLDCFADTEDFDIRFDDSNKIYYIQGRCGKAQKRKFERFIETGEDE